ncbi:S-layer homology domain-containing protein [Peribacillus acanthi]|uniref:S-layer homology domain-containing protein n=1 Tax=Peribacillus acanthi TaxID=2171554 RepID=UPI000D3E4173|nr:S-layer homology domain-containing protein [Peribacillus acanthi]
MKFVKKRITSLVLVFSLLLSIIVPGVSANGLASIRYLALGDSLAAGMTPQKEISSGYSDLTAAYMKEQGALSTYSKEFAVPGYKTDNVLNDLLTKPELQEAVKASNLITISAGANDLLKEAKMDIEKKTLTIDSAKVLPTLQSISKNYAAILQTIKELNPQAKVYVMGYYFPFPYLADSQKPQLIQLAKTLNLAIDSMVTSQGATFVSVYEKFGDDPKQYLPNPMDIHPNIEGYQAMSDALLTSIAKTKPKANDIPSDYWAKKELELLIANNLLTLDDKGNVYPEKPITRAEVADILYKSIPMTKSIPQNPGYQDVPETHPAYMAIAKLTEAGIFSKSEKFNPDSSLTRVQAAKVLTLAFQLKGDGKVPSFKDINAKYWGTPFINAVSTHKLMLGYKNGKFGLHDPINRAQFAVIVVRAQATILTK